MYKYTKMLYLYIFIYVMPKQKSVLLPSASKVLKDLGENIKLARLRRKLSAQQVAERANISRLTLLHVEKGAPSVSMGIYCKVLFVLGLEKDLLKIAADDVLGRKLQDADLTVKERAPKRGSQNKKGPQFKND
jgi:transcriptional regulator with XRE-family HTH domain